RRTGSTRAPGLLPSMDDEAVGGRPQGRRRLGAEQWFALTVAAIGLATMLGLLVKTSLHTVTESPTLFWSLVAMVALGEFFPIKVPRRYAIEAREDEITTSTTCALAILIGYGTAPAVFALAIGSALADAWTRMKPTRVL